MAFIEIRDLFKRYKKTVAVNRISLEVHRGEMLTLLGPSGCGKTTTLRCLAGLERPEAGEIVIDGRPMLSPSFVPPAKRGIGMVFQNYAVWPHMRVFDNVVYGLKIQGLPRGERRDRVREVLEMVGLSGLEERYPSQLSGGQQQRVALARALVRHPKVLLLDEPLSNLDAKLREKMRFEIKSLVRRMGITAVYVTHDQAEAMVISDRVVVMKAGDVLQVGDPRAIYARPANRFVADFIGAMNFIPGELLPAADDPEAAVVRTAWGASIRGRRVPGSALQPGEAVFASIRPEDVRLLPQGAPEGENRFRGRLAHRAYLGNYLVFFVVLGDVEIRVQVPHHAGHAEGEEIDLYLDPEKCLVLP